MKRLEIVESYNDIYVQSRDMMDISNKIKQVRVTFEFVKDVNRLSLRSFFPIFLGIGTNVALHNIANLISNIQKRS